MARRRIRRPCARVLRRLWAWWVRRLDGEEEDKRLERKEEDKRLEWKEEDKRLEWEKEDNGLE